MCQTLYKRLTIIFVLLVSAISELYFIIRDADYGRGRVCFSISVISVLTAVF